jgi:uncharacterized repeat protein (TIGR01451 family)
MRLISIVLISIYSFSVYAGDLEVRTVSAQEGGENFSLQVGLAAQGTEEYDYGRAGSTYDSVDLYNYLRVTPATKFSISTKRNGFLLIGDFKPETEYKITLKAGLRSKEGDKLVKDMAKEVRTGSFKPRFTFKSKSRYLPGSLQGSIAWEAVNVDAVDFEVRQVYPQNLHQWVTSGESANDFVSEAVKTVSQKVKGRKNKVTKGTFALTGMETLGQGVFVVVAKPAKKKAGEAVTAAPSPEEGGEGEEAPPLSDYEYRSEYDRSTVVVTNLTVVAKRGLQEAKVWVMNTRDLKPVDGATVDLIATSNRKLGSCTTAGATAECALTWKKLENTSPYAMIVKAGKDMTYVRFEDLTLPNDAFHAGKRDFTSSAGALDAFVYGERDLYRPGETLKMAAMVRNNKFEAVPKLPLRWTITNPRGKVVRETVSETSEFGVALTEYPSSAASETGKYTVAVYSGKILLHETSVMVEEFVPERIGLKVSPAQEIVIGKGLVPFNVSALYLFGPPVADGTYKMSCSMRPAFREIPNRPGYATGIYTKEAPQAMTLDSKEGTLDAKGGIQETCGYDMKDGKLAEAYQLKAKVDVNEAGSGRATTKTGQAYLASTDTLIGLKLESAKSSTLVVRGGLFDFKGGAKNAKTSVKLKLFNLRDHWYYTYGGYDSWNVEQILTPTSVEKTVEVNGNSFEVSLTTPEGWGRWMVRAVDTKTGYTADLDAGYMGWSYSEHSAKPGMRAPEPSQLKVEVSKREASPGDNIDVMVEAPFAGRVLFAFESDHTLETRWVDVKKPGQVKIAWKIPNVLPNVYVTALLMKDPVEAGGKRFLPARAWGASSVQIVPASQRMDLTVVHPEISESRKTVTFEISNSAQMPTQYDVAVVDEGILQMTDYKSPDPLKRFFEARALGVASIETMGWTVAVENAGGKNPGGDEAGVGESKNMPVKLVSFWFPNLKSDASGKATLQVPLPAFQGKVRIMAVAGSKTRMGSSSSMMTVRDPLVLQSTLPRFLTQGDKFQFPVSVTNLSGKDQNVTVEVAPGAMVAMTNVKQQVKVPNGQARVVQFGAEVKGVNGMASIGVKAFADKLNSVERFDLPVKPSGIEQTIRLSLDTKQEAVLASYIPKDWRSDYARVEASVSPMPYLNQMSHLDTLIQYPYGCIEQTTSATMPLLVMGDLLQWVAPQKAAQMKIKDVVHRGIARVISMQTASGGFGYWPGDGTPNPWGTAYATHMLLDAKKLGYEVSPGALKSALDYLESYTRDSAYNLASTARRYETEAEPFALYVLAKGGRAVTQELRDVIRSYKPVSSQKWTGVRGENFFLLSAAAKVLGDKDSIKNLTDDSAYAMQLVGEREDDYTYWSPMRADGLRMSVLEDINPKHPAIETLAIRVAASLATKDNYYSTQDIAWSVLALGKRLNGMKKPDAATLAKVGLVMNGKRLPKAFEVAGAPGFRFDGPNLSAAKLQVSDAPAEKGTYLYVKATGYTKMPPPSRSPLSIQRTFYKRDGSSMDASGIKQGDTVFVELTVQNTGESTVKNIAIVDRVPAGFEIENPRLGKSEDLQWMKDAFKAEYQDLRDDRLQVFGDLAAGSTQYIYYSARAVTKGQFTAPAAFVEAMYDPANFDYDKDTPVQIVEAAKK